MIETKNPKFPFQELIEDNKVVITELPTKTQELISKFPSITDPDAQDSMNLRIYGQIDDFLEAKAEKEKQEKTKAKIAEGKKKKQTLDVSSASTAKTPEQLAAEKAAEDAKNGKPAEKKGGLMDFVFGRK